MKNRTTVNHSILARQTLTKKPVTSVWFTKSLVPKAEIKSFDLETKPIAPITKPFTDDLNQPVEKLDSKRIELAVD